MTSRKKPEVKQVITDRIKSLLAMTDALTVELNHHQNTIIHSIAVMQTKYIDNDEKDFDLYDKYVKSAQMEKLITLQLGTTFDSLIELWTVVKDSGLELELEERDISRLERNIQNNPALFTLQGNTIVFSDKQTEAAIKTANEKSRAEKPQLIDRFFENLKTLKINKPKDKDAS